jgi:uncharacterized membrane protein
MSTSHTPRRFLTWCLIFASMATLIAGYLLWATTGDRGQVLGCGPGSGCDKVLGSRWSLWLGQPVSLFALGFYIPFTLCILALSRSRSDSVRWLPWLMVVACSASLVMLWFVGLQAIVIKSFCLYCVADHTLGLLAVACLLLYARRSGVRPGLARWALSLVLVGGFVAVHLAVAPTRIHVVDIEGPPPFTDPRPTNLPTIESTAAGPSRMVSLMNGQVLFDIHKIPCLGSPEAEFVIVELFDYTCSHCRSLHPHLHNALERYGDQLAIVTLPVPLNSDCNSHIQITQPVHQDACMYAAYSMAVCAFDREQYPPYHDWLMTAKVTPTAEEARARAELIMGTGSVDNALTNRMVQDWLETGSTMYQRGNRGSIPKLIVGTRIVAIPHTTSENLFKFLESSLPIKPVIPVSDQPN